VYWANTVSAIASVFIKFTFKKILRESVSDFMSYYHIPYNNTYYGAPHP